MDWAPRQQRKRARLIDAAANNSNRTFAASQPKRKLREYWEFRWMSIRNGSVIRTGMTVGSLDMTWDEPGSEMVNQLSDSEQHWPSQLLEKSELNRLLVRAVERLRMPSARS